MTGTDFGLYYLNLFNIYSTSTASVAIRNMGGFMGPSFFSDFIKKNCERKSSFDCLCYYYKHGRNMGGRWGSTPTS